jgi:hypothetical protein
MGPRSLSVWAVALLATALLARCGSSDSNASDAGSNGTAPDVGHGNGGDFENWVSLDASTPAPGQDASAAAGQDASSLSEDHMEFGPGDTGTAPGLDASAATGLDASTGPCCVVFTIGDGGTQTFCKGPALTGTSAATPTIGIVTTPYGTNVELHSGLAQAQSQKNALYVTAYQHGNDAGLVQAGTFAVPQIDFYGPTGGWWENNASNGGITLDSWTATGTQITGTFNGQIADMSGSGGFPAISGSFCAVRAADE